MHQGHSSDSDTGSEVSTPEEYDENDEAQVDTSEDWENVLRLKESAHQTEIDILNDRHQAEMESLEKSYGHEVERLERNLRVHKNMIEGKNKKYAKLSNDFAQKDALLESQTALVRKTEGDALLIKAQKDILWRGVMRCLRQIMDLKKQLRQQDIVVENLHLDHVDMRGRLNASVVEKTGMRNALDQLQNQINEYRAHLAQREIEWKNNAAQWKSDAAKLEQLTAIVEADNATRLSVQMLDEAAAENASLKGQLEDRVDEIQNLYCLKAKYDTEKVNLYSQHDAMVHASNRGMAMEILKRGKVEEDLELLKIKFKESEAEKERLNKALKAEKSNNKMISGSSQQPSSTFANAFVPRQHLKFFGKKLDLQTLSNTSADAFSKGIGSPPASPDEGLVFPKAGDSFMQQWESQSQWPQGQPTHQAQQHAKTTFNQEGFSFPFPASVDPFVNSSEQQLQGSQRQSGSQASHGPVPNTESRSKQNSFPFPSTAAADPFTQRSTTQSQWPENQSLYQACQETKPAVNQDGFEFTFSTTEDPFVQRFDPQPQRPQDFPANQASYSAVPETENEINWDSATGTAAERTQTSTTTQATNGIHSGPWNHDAASSNPFLRRNSKFSNFWNQKPAETQTGSNTMAATSPDTQQVIDHDTLTGPPFPHGAAGAPNDTLEPNMQELDPGILASKLGTVATGCGEERTQMIDTSSAEKVHDDRSESIQNGNGGIEACGVNLMNGHKSGDSASPQNMPSPSASQGFPKPPKDKKAKNKQRTALRKAAKSRLRAGAAMAVTEVNMS